MGNNRTRGPYAGPNSGLTEKTKIEHLKKLADYRVNTLRKNPKLHHLFLEMTIKCNEHCRHCGSRCGDIREDKRLSYDEICAFLTKIKNDFAEELPMLCITGGEPLLREDLFEIMTFASNLGFHWGMTSNGTLITKEIAHRLALAGMKTISISVDGLKENHEWFRQSPCSYERTMHGILNLLDEKAFSHVQITTVVNRRNYAELEEMYKVFSETGVQSWRVIGIEPMGRAKDQPELLLTPDQQRGLFSFICSHRFRGKMMVTYGCSHFLGFEFEREVRPWYFLCNAGVYTASITYNGDITSCLDVERRPDIMQGNIREDDFTKVWKEKFRIYRTDFRKTGKCANCREYDYCAGDSFHSWDFDNMEPMICMKELLKAMNQ